MPSGTRTPRLETGAKWRSSREQLGRRGAAALEPHNPGRKLRIAKGLIELQKKAHAILGIALPTFDESSVLDDEESS